MIGKDDSIRIWRQESATALHSIPQCDRHSFRRRAHLALDLQKMMLEILVERDKRRRRFENDDDDELLITDDSDCNTSSGSASSDTTQSSSWLGERPPPDPG